MVRFSKQDVTIIMQCSQSWQRPSVGACAGIGLIASCPARFRAEWLVSPGSQDDTKAVVGWLEADWPDEQALHSSDLSRVG